MSSEGHENTNDASPPDASSSSSVTPLKPEGASMRRPFNASIEEEQLSYASPIYPGLMLGSVRASHTPWFVFKHGITHILTVAREAGTGLTDAEKTNLDSYLMERGWAKGVEYKKLEVDDNSDFEILAFLEQACSFIESALVPRYDNILTSSMASKQVLSSQSPAPMPAGPLPDAPAGSPYPPPHLPTVLVHCQLGVSRSTTVVAAHLIRLWHRCSGEGTWRDPSVPTLPSQLLGLLHIPPAPLYHQPPKLSLLAIKHLTRRRNIVYPNDGFRIQLAHWERMGGRWGSGPGAVYEASKWANQAGRGLNKTVDGWLEGMFGVKLNKNVKVPKKVLRYREDLAKERRRDTESSDDLSVTGEDGKA